MPINELPFKHNCINGSYVTAERCDFVGGIDVYAHDNSTVTQLAQDMLELGAFHWANIVSRNLNGYTGPPEIRIHYVRK